MSMQSPRPALDILAIVRKAAEKEPDNKSLQDLLIACKKEYDEIKESCDSGWY